ncbi:hypothetical protein Cgig2_012526 [Carnegiea gigantea]|uniref:Uncharacterized protein n=1 Tax=Carnegiea gigantea TaxID=171969 RepID=A0A9Q1GID0_9CARY|nr:hypothetical protein Cgig2_012526 [Carnegiea gigantea]
MRPLAEGFNVFLFVRPIQASYVPTCDIDHEVDGINLREVPSYGSSKEAKDLDMGAWNELFTAVVADPASSATADGGCCDVRIEGVGGFVFTSGPSNRSVELEVRASNGDLLTVVSGAGGLLEVGAWRWLTASVAGPVILSSTDGSRCFVQIEGVSGYASSSGSRIRPVEHLVGASNGGLLTVVSGTAGLSSASFCCSIPWVVGGRGLDCAGGDGGTWFGTVRGLPCFPPLPWLGLCAAREPEAEDWRIYIYIFIYI